MPEVSMHILRFMAAALAAIGGLAAAPVLVSVEGNFGPSDDVATVFDNQAYVASFPIPDPAHPQQQIAAPDIDFFSATYATIGSLSVPGIGLVTQEPVEVQFIEQGGATWMNIFAFRNVPVGDFILATPVETLSGAPLWNGLAGAFGTPALFVLDHEPAFAFWRLQQIPPGQPASIPLASYQIGTASITIAVVPEPSTAGLLPIGLAAMGIAFRCFRGVKLNAKLM
jgi:hypothetical protein